MEIFEEEEKTKNRHTRILLILNLIIWTIILFMVILWNGVVNAATTTDVMDNFIIYKEGGTSQQGNNGASVTTSGSVEAINFNFGNLEGNVSGQVQITFKYLTNRVGGMYLYVYTGGNLDTNASTSKSCQFTQNGNYYTAKCQFNFNTINETSKYTLLQVQFNPVNNILANIYTASGTAQITPTDLATSNDIQQQTISIIQNAISNTMSISEQIIQSNTDLSNAIANIMNNATTSIQNSLMHCQDYMYTKTTVPKSKENYYLDGYGREISANGYDISDYIPINSGQTYTYTITRDWTNTPSYCLYDINKTQVSCTQYGNALTINITPNENGYIKYTVARSGTTNFTGRYCQSNTDAIIENQNQNTAEIIAAIGGLEGYHTNYTPDTSDFEDLEDAEDTLHQYTNVNLNSFNVDLDTNTNNWVWNTLTSLLNTSALVFGMVISILSIGLIKLILNR